MNNLDDEFFNKLNETIRTWLDSDLHKLYEERLQKIVPLAFVIIDNTPDIVEKDMGEYIDINDSINLVVNFFQSINPEYAYRLQNIINWEKNNIKDKEDYSVRFYRITDKDVPDYEGQNKKNNSYSNINGEVHVDYNNTINDAFIFAHEMAHKFSTPYMQQNIIKSFFSETSSGEIEFLLYDYLMSHESFIKDINSILINRFSSSCKSAFNVIFEYILLKLYRENNNYVNKQILLDYFNSMDKNSKLYNLFYNNGLKLLKRIVRKQELSFPISQRYVIGTILACDFHKRKKQGLAVLDELFKLIEILGKGYICDEDVKELMNFIPIIDTEGFKIDENVLKRLTDTYKSELEEILSRQEILENNNKL